MCISESYDSEVESRNDLEEKLIAGAAESSVEGNFEERQRERERERERERDTREDRLEISERGSSKYK